MIETDFSWTTHIPSYAKGGQHTNGRQAYGFTLTHIPTGIQIVVPEEAAPVSQVRHRESLKAMMQLIVEEMNS